MTRHLRPPERLDCTRRPATESVRDTSGAPALRLCLLELLHCGGVADSQVGDVREGSVQAVALPAGTPPSVVAEAIRFALAGRAAHPQAVSTTRRRQPIVHGVPPHGGDPAAA